MEVLESYVSQSVILRIVQKVFTYFSPVTLICFFVVGSWIYGYQKKHARMAKLVNRIPGPTALPLIGNAIEINVDHDELFGRITGGRKLFGRRQGVSRIWNFSMPYIFVSKPEWVEVILSSPKHIDKSDDYNFLHPWLGTGLLTSHGQKWFTRRKILTPAFHFKILDDFMDVFNEQSAIMVKKMAKEINSDSFNIFPYVTLCTLDIVCETAMGQHLNAQGDKDSDYVRAVYEIGSLVQNRQSKFWLQWEPLFRLTDGYKRHQECIKILHDFSYRVIRERKQQIKAEQELKMMKKLDDNNNPVTNDDDNFGSKKRLAFLDLLISACGNGSIVTDEDIREEVDTFMFEGHDTTSAAVSWCLFLLGENPKVQERAFHEIDSVMGGDRTRPPTMKELGEMRYLECCIKEALRLYPSVPLIARKLKEDIQIDQYTVPADATVMIVTYMLHRDPDIFHSPDRYIPERFLSENCIGRHPYSYIPFSAGPRNCIGQKFAILEEKSIISSVLRNYKIESIDRREDLTLLGELILRPKDGLAVKITPRGV